MPAQVRSIWLLRRGVPLEGAHAHLGGITRVRVIGLPPCVVNYAIKLLVCFPFDCLGRVLLPGRNQQVKRIGLCSYDTTGRWRVRGRSTVDEPICIGKGLTAAAADRELMRRAVFAGRADDVLTGYRLRTTAARISTATAADVPRINVVKVAVAVGRSGTTTTAPATSTIDSQVQRLIAKCSRAIPCSHNHGMGAGGHVDCGADGADIALGEHIVSINIDMPPSYGISRSG